jgi:hypothetical protein
LPPACGDLYVGIGGCSSDLTGTTTGPTKKRDLNVFPFSEQGGRDARDKRGAAGGNPDCSGQGTSSGSRPPVPGTSCTTSGIGILLGSDSCPTSTSTPPPTCPPYLTGVGVKRDPSLSVFLLFSPMFLYLFLICFFPPVSFLLFL